MTTEETIRAAIGSYVAGDLDGAMELCSDDVCFHVAGNTGLGGLEIDCHTRDDFRNALIDLLGEFEMQKYELVELIAEGERAATRQNERMRHRET